MHEVSAEGPQEEEQESGEAIMMPLNSSQVSSSEEFGVVRFWSCYIGAVAEL